MTQAFLRQVSAVPTLCGGLPILAEVFPKAQECWTRLRKENSRRNPTKIGADGKIFVSKTSPSRTLTALEGKS
jgi:hypothetical protein